MWLCLTQGQVRLLNVKQIIEIQGADLCSALPSLHCFTGFDTTSAFVQR